MIVGSNHAKKQFNYSLHVVTDSLAAVVCMWLCYLVTNPQVFSGKFFQVVALSLVVFFCVLVCLTLAGFYRVWSPDELWKEYKTLNSGMLMAYGMLLLIGYLLKVSHLFSRQAVILWMLLFPACVAVERYFYRSMQKRLNLVEAKRRSLVLAGIGELGLNLSGWALENPWLGFEYKGFFDDRLAPPGEKYQRLGSLDSLPGYVKDNSIDTVFITLPMRAEGKIRYLLKKLADSTCSVYFFPDISFFKLLMGADVSHVAGYPALTLRETPFQGFNAFLKRIEDIVLSSIILILISPLLLAIAVLIKLDSKGPVLFRQWRYGMGGEPFQIFKFRTMKVLEDGYEFKAATRDDERITRVGRFLRRNSLDELPQFFNVLQGRMSIVGPRPHAVAMNEEYRKVVSGYMLRHMAKPGITGLAQVRGYRGEILDLSQMNKRIMYDIQYMQNWSLFFDMRIILETVFGKVWRQF